MKINSPSVPPPLNYQPTYVEYQPIYIETPQSSRSAALIAKVDSTDQKPTSNVKKHSADDENNSVAPKKQKIETKDQGAASNSPVTTREALEQKVALAEQQFEEARIEGGSPKKTAQRALQAAKKNLAEYDTDSKKADRERQKGSSEFKNNVDDLNKYLLKKHPMGEIQFKYASPETQREAEKAFPTKVIPHPAYKTGELSDQRLQDYLALGLKRVLNNGTEQPNSAKNRASDVKPVKGNGLNGIIEIQMAGFGKIRGGDSLYRNLAISGNCTKDNNKLLDKFCKYLNITAENAKEVAGAHLLENFNLRDFSRRLELEVKDIHAKKIPPSKQRLPGNLNKIAEADARHAEKLTDRIGNVFGPSVNIFIPKIANQHAELVVDKLIKSDAIGQYFEKMNMNKDRLPTSGSRLPCVGCASKLIQAGETITGATLLYNSQPADYDGVAELFDQNLSLGDKYVPGPGSSYNHYPRRRSISPSDRGRRTSLKNT